MRRAIFIEAMALTFACGCMPPSWGANALLHPGRTHAMTQPDLPHEDISFTGDDGIALKGWLFRTAAPRRGLLVYLHGISNNRGSGVGIAHRFVPEGWDVLVYDARDHGDSGGTFCSYGVLEKRDLSRALDAVKADKTVLFGSSLGAAVALQAAAIDPRVVGVIAQSSFSELRRIARERAPFFASQRQIDEAFAIAEQEAHFRVDDASPLTAAATIHVPVLLIHGADDHETSADHSRALFAALHEPKQLILVPGAGHNDVMQGPDIWRTVEHWLNDHAW